MEDNARAVTPFQFIDKEHLSGMRDFVPHQVDPRKETDPKASSAAESATSSRSGTTAETSSSENEESLAHVAKGSGGAPPQQERSTRLSLPSPKSGKTEPPAAE